MANTMIQEPPSSSSSRRSRSLLANVPVYRITERATEYLLLFMVIFSPWAFGTTEEWSIWTMNLCGYMLGLLLLNKLLCRRVITGSWSHGETTFAGRCLTRSLLIVSSLIVIYCLLAVWNPRASFDDVAKDFDYFPSFYSWLPHTYHLERSLGCFFSYAALFCTFWATYDWLATGSAHRHRHEEGLDTELESEAPEEEHSHRLEPPPRRLWLLLWVLSVNGALLACEGLIQRADGGAKLLWVAEGAVNREATSQFGPYAYRSNAAQYFNLLWPMVLGFWWWLERVAHQRDPDARHAPHRILLPIAALMAVCPLVSLSRAGAIVTILTGTAASALLILHFDRRYRRRAISILAGCLLLIGAGAVAMDGGALMKRFQTSSADLVVGRERSYELASKMASDFPVFGTGPGSFEAVFQLYRNTVEDYWPAQLHNDWLETLITFGWLGMGLILIAFMLMMWRWPAASQGIVAPRLFVGLIWIGMGGCLLHARVDFPFQVYSILMLFLIQGAVLFALTRETPMESSR